MKTTIDSIGNCYGGLVVMELEGKYYWCIENYDTDLDNLDEWEQISKKLYCSIIEFNGSKAKP